MLRMLKEERSVSLVFRPGCFKIHGATIVADLFSPSYGETKSRFPGFTALFFNPYRYTSFLFIEWKTYRLG